MDILEEFIRATLMEAAVSDVSDYALYIKEMGNEINILLYDYKPAVDQIKNKQRVKIDNSNAVGMIKVRKDEGNGPCHHAWEVIAVKAQKGFGPFMYDAAMSLVPSKTLMPDRASVTGDAKRIWSYYLQNREDVAALELDDSVEPGTEESIDDCFNAHYSDKDLINYAFRLKGEGPNMRPAIMKHERLTQILQKHGRDQELSRGLNQILSSYY